MIAAELNAACRIDPGLGAVLERAGYPQPRSREPGFATLVEIINAQQLSTKAAAAIWRRVERSCRGAVTPKKILNRSPHQLRQCGLSSRKVSYVTGLAESLLSKQLVLKSLERMPDEEVIAGLTRIKGLGRWSAEIYAMFALDRKDIFPANDVALQVAVQRCKKLGSRPDERQTRQIADQWSPHRTAVAVLLWKYYGATALD